MRPAPSRLALLVTYLALVALALASWLAATTIGSPALALAIATLKLLAIAIVFMELSHAHAVDRSIAAVTAFFILLITAGILADVAFR